MKLMTTLLVDASLSASFVRSSFELFVSALRWYCSRAALLCESMSQLRLLFAACFLVVFCWLCWWWCCFAPCFVGGFDVLLVISVLRRA